MWKARNKRKRLLRAANEKKGQTNAKTKDRETYSAAKELACVNYAKWYALKQRKDHGQNQGKARLAKKT